MPATDSSTTVGAPSKRLAGLHAITANIGTLDPVEFFGNSVEGNESVLTNFTFAGTHSGDGSSLTNLPASAPAGLANVTTTPYTASTDTFIIVNDTTAGAEVTVNLPASSGLSGTVYTIKKIGTSYNVVIDGSGSETIDGALVATITLQYETISIVCDGSNWFVY